MIYDSTCPDVPTSRVVPNASPTMTIRTVRDSGCPETQAAYQEFRTVMLNTAGRH